MRENRRTAARVLTVACVGAALAGCSPTTGRSKTAASSAAPAATSVPPTSNFEVLSFGPTAAPAATTAGLDVSFSKAVDPAWLLYGTTWFAVEDVDQTPGGSYRTITGRIELDASGTRATFTPDRAFRARHEVRLILASTLRDTEGGVLASGTVGKNVHFTNALQNEVFEGVFLPG